MPEETKNDVSVQAAEDSSPSVQPIAVTPDSNPAFEESRKATLASVVERLTEQENKTSSETRTEETEAQPEKEEKEEKEETPTPEKAEKEEEKEEAKETKPEDKDKDLPFGKHPRWKEVLKERDEARTQAAEAAQQLESLKPLLEPAQALHEICEKNNISQADLNVALELTILAKTDMKSFGQKLEKILEGINVQLGTKLPEDLQKKVDDGKMEVEDAQELAKSRLSARAAKAAADEAARQARESQDALAASSTNAVRSAVSEWSLAMSKTDPDYKLDQDGAPASPFAESVFECFQSLAIAKTPKTIKDAITLADEAYNRCVKRVRAFRPPPPQRRATPANHSSRTTEELGPLDNLSRDNVLKHVRWAIAHSNNNRR